MQLIVTEHTHCHHIKITGRIDSFSAPQIKEALKTLLADGHFNMIIDLQDVNYISSSGILIFIEIQRQLKRQNKGEIVFANVSDFVNQNFELAGFDTIFEFYKDTPAALDHF